jgi:hypothetical protein
MFNKKERVTIVEPQNFTSSEGDNKLIVEILAQTSYGLIVKCCSNFNRKKNRLRFQRRNADGDYNIYGIDDSILGDEMDIASLEHIMIGTMDFYSKKGN